MIISAWLREGIHAVFKLSTVFKFQVMIKIEAMEPLYTELAFVE